MKSIKPWFIRWRNWQIVYLVLVLITTGAMYWFFNLFQPVNVMTVSVWIPVGYQGNTPKSIESALQWYESGFGWDALPKHNIKLEELSTLYGEDMYQFIRRDDSIVCVDYIRKLNGELYRADQCWRLPKQAKTNSQKPQIIDGKMYVPLSRDWSWTVTMSVLLLLLSIVIWTLPIAKIQRRYDLWKNRKK